MSALYVPSPAKLNLFLHITGQRENGYHELQTIFQLIDLCDDMYFELNDQNQINVNGLDHVELTQNLIYRAAMMLKPYCSEQLGCTIQINKKIPIGAGLGGGSSNAATTLLVLNQLWQCKLSQTQLLDIAAQLGADVPIFIYGQNAWAEGIGEIITPLENLPLSRYLILKPDCFISTQALFSEKTLTRNSKPSKFAAYQQNANHFVNHFEPLARKIYPQVEDAFTYLNQYGQAKLTGTGACVFVEIDHDVNTDTMLKNAPCQAFLANSLTHSPVLDLIKSW